MNVSLLNKEQTKDFFKMWGEFACTCYNTDKKYAKKVGEKCYESGHFSGSRAFSFIFEVKGISRACSHQLVRSSVGVTINQKSQRYCNEEKFDYVIPTTIEKNEKAKKIFIETMDNISDKYKEISNILSKELKGEKLNQDVRYVLPNACKTDLTIGFTLEALIKFCEERLCMASQWEIRELANKFKKEVIEVLPELESKLNSKCINLGYCPEAENRCCGIRPNKNKIRIIKVEE